MQWWTRGPYSHCELVIDGLCFSSSLRDGGVRVKRIDLTTGRWDVVTVQADAQHARDWFYAHLGAGYDAAGLLGFVLPWRTQDRRRWFCSEACAEALLMPESWAISPNGLARLVGVADDLLTKA
ncbi:hypothetical protein LP416_27790 [Polaromonas sp. P2-4]|nr:hypothetical protein LP416_27790 [Polaromonas sp. P2-4]